MPKPIGPTIPRWQLGEQLSALREQAGLSQADASERLGCSISKIQKIEAGDVGIVRAELLHLLDAYDVHEAGLRSELIELQSMGKQRGWWSKLGQVPTPFATFLGLESAARSIHSYECTLIPGLLQTERYSRAIAETCDVDVSQAQVEQQVKIRLERQQHVLDEDPPSLWVILDEAVLRRAVGGPDVMAEQLHRLSLMSKQITLQVVPFSAGGYPGVRGAMTIFEFDEDMHSPVAYVECQAGNLYMEKTEDLHRCLLAFSHMTAAALSRQESAKIINAVAEEYERSAA